MDAEVMYSVIITGIIAIPMLLAFIFLNVDLVSIFEKPLPVEKDPETEFIIGYKWLYYVDLGLRRVYYSMWNESQWERNEDGVYALSSDRLPTKGNKHGIYATKSLDSRELEEHFGRMVQRNYYNRDGAELVMVLLHGTVIEGATGYRAEHAEIVSYIDSRSFNADR